MTTGQLDKALFSEMGRASHYFQATKDLKWLVRYAEVDRQRKQFTRPSTSEPHLPTVEEFTFALRTPAALRTRDKLQTASNFVMASALSQYLENVEPGAPALKSLTGKGLGEVLSPGVFPDDPKKMAELRQIFNTKLSSLRLGEDLEEGVFRATRDDKGFHNLLQYTLTLAYVQALKNAVIMNPIMAIIPPEELLKKTAHLISVAAVDPEGTRLSQFIEALRLSIALMAQEYNQASIISRAPNSPAVQSLFGKTDMRINKAQIRTLPRSFRTVVQYLSVYERLARDLEAYMNPSDPRLKAERQNRIIPGTEIPVTANPPISEQGPAGLFDFLSSDRLFKNLKGFSMTDVHGKPQSPSKAIGIKQTDLARIFSATEVPEEFAEELVSNISDGLGSAAEFRKPGSVNSTTEVFKGILKPDAALTPDGLDAELESALRAEVERYTQANQDLLSAAQGEALQGQAPEAKTLNSQSMKQYETGLISALAKSVENLTAKYQDRVTQPDILREQIRKIAVERVLPFSPFTERFIRSANFSYPAERATRLALKDETDRYVNQHFVSVISDPRFRYSKEIAEEEEDELARTKSSDYVGYLNEQAARLRNSPELLDKLGIDPKAIEARMAEAVAGLDEPEEGKFNSKRQVAARRAISEALDEPLKIPPQELQAMLGDIPIEALYVHLSDVFITYEKDHNLITYLKALAAKRAPEAAKGDIPNQVQGFINDKYYTTREGTQKGTLTNSLAVGSVPGKIQEWHRDREKILASGEGRTRRGSPFLWGHLFRQSHLALSTETREVASKYISKMLSANAADPRITDDNWDDVSNPKPRNWSELAHVVGAFADPLPGVRIEEGDEMPLDEALKEVREGKVPRRPGQLISASYVKDKDGKTVIPGVDTPRQHMRRMLSRIGYGVVPSTMVGGTQARIENPISELRAKMAERRDEIMRIPEWREHRAELAGFDIDKHKSYEMNNFVEGVDNSTGREFSKKDALLHINGAPEGVLSAAQKTALMNVISSFGRDDAAFKSKGDFLSRLPAYMSVSTSPIEKNLQEELISLISEASQPVVVSEDTPADEEKEAPAKKKAPAKIKELSVTDYIKEAFDKLNGMIDNMQAIGWPQTKEDFNSLGRLIISTEQLIKQTEGLIAHMEMSEQEKAGYQAFKARAQQLIEEIRVISRPADEASGQDDVSFVLLEAKKLAQHSIPWVEKIHERHGPEVADDILGLVRSVTEGDNYRALVHPQKTQDILGALRKVFEAPPGQLRQFWPNAYQSLQGEFRNRTVAVVDPKYGEGTDTDYYEAKDRYYHV